MIEAERIVPTTCPYCGVGCQVHLHVRDDTIYRVSGRFESPVNHGNLCVKGRFGTDFVDSPDRLDAAACALEWPAEAGLLGGRPGP